ncbi:hypothetical protein OsI_02338 [Oryza sativa Indica Group]|uniref:Uncharacterized protein n=1 Tax=Oryza sativa subsp. indica TaxID=39946 RepID=B8AA26_ORYSI|nr:hypothetical protein OsI_02338 [Oryza sativa Indica Group]
MGRESAAACSPKPKLRRGLWSPEEDEKLFNHISRYGVGCWSSVPKLAGLERCGKSCRLRWINYLRPDLKRGSFSQQEEELIISLHKILGNRWSQIAAQLPGRTDNEIKNFWNSCLKKKLRQRGIDPATHKPLNDGGAGAGEEHHDDGDKQQLMDDVDDCFAIGGGGSSDSLAPPHSPAVSFDPLPEDEVVSHGYPNLELRFLSLPALTLKESSRYISDHLDLTSLAHRLLSHPPRHLDSSPAWGGGRAISTHKALCPSSVASSSALPRAWPVSNRWSSLDLLMASDHAAS